MKTIYDIQQYLKKFGTFIYIGDRIADLELMEEEIRELYKAQCMSSHDYQMAILLLRSEMAEERERLRGEGTS
ncbi:YqgQ family protein [Halobacillus sp. ACCC02827]|uniref:YqgQ family protein n=1 Tax=Bacillaceae TaxID=186817 RepID=UPI000421E15D|nr:MULTISPECIES: YqgQ family protein [Bacillaceae]QHT47161.1 YqgQ family protein [Bacillus sp. SB49]WJE14390.1 YqgQ family protein [Halobacillus sp. ACCC02827]